MDQLKCLEDMGCEVTPCGSRVTCNPPPVDTDEDYLVVVPDKATKISAVVNYLGIAGFDWEGSEHYQTAASTFMSWRKDNINLIVTANKSFAEKHKLATRICKKLNLMAKDQRIALFQEVLYG